MSDPDLARLQAELDAERARADAAHARLLTFGAIQAALGRLRALGTTEGLIRRAPAEVAAAAGFDRVLLFRVKDALLVCESIYIDGDAAGAKRLLAFSRAHPARLQDQILETEMVRRRRPMVVHDAQNHPQTFKPLVTPYGTTAYVAAPIMPEGRVIGFLHADKGLSRPGSIDAVDDVDRDALFAFAEGLGYAVERMALLDRLRGQGQELLRLIAQAEGVVSAQLAAQVELVPLEGAEARSAQALLGDAPVDARLTRREQEVLALVAQGATNGQIADALVITEGTAKSHVKRILRKLGAANRVEAASLYLRGAPAPPTR